MKLLIVIWKESLLLIRDKAGLAVLYIMPLALIVLMALIQDAPFKDYKNADIPVLIINHDKDSLAAKISASLKNAGMFRINEVIEEDYDSVRIMNIANSGDYKAVLVIKKNATRDFKKDIKIRIEKSFSAFSPVKSKYVLRDKPTEGVEVWWDPVIKKSFKDGVLLALEKVIVSYQANLMMTQVEARLKKLSADEGIRLENKPAMVVVQKESAETDFALNGLNSVQHNVPAWAIFGIFFIVLPLSGNVIKEREQKTMLRVHLIPGSLPTLIIGKILTYLLVAASQFILVVIAGKFLLPLLGLPSLYTGDSYTAIVLTVLALGMAASAYGVFVGTAFRTYQQASTFGSVSVVILAAIGGIWVPVFVMPSILQNMSLISPLGWGMSAFNSIFLRGSGVTAIISELLLLFGFSGIMFLLSFILEKKR